MGKRKVIGLLLTLTIGRVFALDAEQLKIIETVKQNYPKQLELVKETVNINSGTHNLEGVKKVAKHYQTLLTSMGFQTKWVDVPAELHRAGHLFAYKHGSDNDNRLLLIGHLDTVFSKKHPFQRYSQKGNYAYGPGVSDNKGGNAVLVYALKALADNQLLKDANITVALIGDEEDAGLPHDVAREALVAEGKISKVALGFESASNLTQVVTARRGVATWKLDIHARAGHSSLIFTPQFGQGAILALSNVLANMEDAIKDIPGLTFNPGVFVGGREAKLNDVDYEGASSGKANIISARAISEGEVRYLYKKDLQKFKHQFLAQLNKLKSPIKGKLLMLNEAIMPAMEPSNKNQELFKELWNINEALHLGMLEPHDPKKRGGADISYVAKDVAGLDGLGAVGGNEHASEEFMDIKKTNIATQRAALLIYQLLR